ncbi:MAG TPA: acyl-CoA dehydrogenase family protein [Nocardioides sp.]|uniref:acyl-CoA dehydrogenase family protein n=1 Tax=Nocardioides sp. TaxID=35761 RepID=UPI002C63D46A|nr:acyl-CoA dehydrogenase family protein [Nocardioides sp.]HQR27201.1 acyl-CoA dehydrogenase family protein [Nocardioides sp.]
MHPAYPAPSARAVELEDALVRFMREEVFPREAAYRRFRETHSVHDTHVPPVLEELKALAFERGLWNLFLPHESGLTQLEYASLAELTGWSVELAPEALNCSAPDTGNMELLDLLGTPQQKERWLRPLLAGEIRSAFAMTEPEVASSDATNIETSIVRDGDEYVINGRKWWISGSADPRCRVLIVMGKTDPGGPVHRQQSMVIVPMDTPGVELVRNLPVFSSYHFQGHCELAFTDVRVPVENILGEEGGGFAAAQARLGPGRMHHVMRALGVGERALAHMVSRTQQRVAFGKPLAGQSAVRERIAESRIELDQARALCHRAAYLLDSEGNKAARHLVAEAKVAVPRAVLSVIDKAIQVHGGAGVSGDTPLAEMWGWQRAMRIFDGPDEVHLQSIAKAELTRPPLFEV